MGGPPLTQNWATLRFAGHEAFNIARALDGCSPRQLRFMGMPSADVWRRVAAGMLLEITLDGFDLTEEHCAGLVAATKSPKCRLRKVAVVKCSLAGARGGKFAADLVRGLPGLEALNLYNNELGPDGMKLLAPAIKASKSMANAHQLNVGKTALGEQGATLFLPALKAMRSVNNFDLSDNALESKGSQVIAPAVSRLTDLEWFNLENNGFGPGGAAAMGPALAHMPKMLGIFLFGNKLGGPGMKALAAGLRKMPKLIMLHLGKNQLGAAGAAGAAALVPVFEACPKLNSVDLQDNQLDTCAVEIIGPALAKLGELGDLRVADNGLGANGGEGARALVPFLKPLAKLHTLYWEKDDIDDATKELIREALPAACVVHF